MIGALHELLVDPLGGVVGGVLAADPPDVLARRAVVDAEVLHHREDVLVAGGDGVVEVVAVDHVLGAAVDGAGAAAPAVGEVLADGLQRAVPVQRGDAIAGAVLVGHREEVSVGPRVRPHRRGGELRHGGDGAGDQSGREQGPASGRTPHRPGAAASRRPDGVGRAAERLPARIGRRQGGRAGVVEAHEGDCSAPAAGTGSSSSLRDHPVAQRTTKGELGRGPCDEAVL